MPGREGEWCFLERDGTELVRFQLDELEGAAPGCEPRGLLRLEPPALEVPELPLLILLGWRIVVQSAAAREAVAMVSGRSAGEAGERLHPV
jgi:hypothetical protein